MDLTFFKSEEEFKEAQAKMKKLLADAGCDKRAIEELSDSEEAVRKFLSDPERYISIFDLSSYGRAMAMIMCLID